MKDLNFLMIRSMLIYHSIWAALPTAPNTVGFLPYPVHLNTAVKPTIRAHAF